MFCFIFYHFLGDCWLLAAVASLSVHRELLEYVRNSFVKIFHYSSLFEYLVLKMTGFQQPSTILRLGCFLVRRSRSVLICALNLCQHKIIVCWTRLFPWFANVLRENSREGFPTGSAIVSCMDWVNCTYSDSLKSGAAFWSRNCDFLLTINSNGYGK